MYDNGDIEETARLVELSKDFLENHLQKWVPKFVSRLGANTEGLYFTLAKLLTEYIFIDATILSSLALLQNKS